MKRHFAKKVVCQHGHKHDSGAEALRCAELHTLFRAGQIEALVYGRTFKLSDFPDALWLLHSTKCDASEDGTGSDWFYMPTLKATIDNDTFHVEVRDGVHETWSDEFAPGPDQPLAAAREIKLYRV